MINYFLQIDSFVLDEQETGELSEDDSRLEDEDDLEEDSEESEDDEVCLLFIISCICCLHFEIFNFTKFFFWNFFCWRKLILRGHVWESWVFKISKNLLSFFALAIAFACKSYHLSPKMSSFQKYSSELLPIWCFWLFLTTFVLFVLEWSVLVPEQCQAHPEVAFES